MFNQVLIVGDVYEIYDNHIDIKVGNSEEIIPVDMSEELLCMLLLNNNVGVRGHIEMIENIPHIICDTLTVLDRRGKKNGN